MAKEGSASKKPAKSKSNSTKKASGSAQEKTSKSHTPATLSSEFVHSSDDDVESESSEESAIEPQSSQPTPQTPRVPKPTVVSRREPPSAKSINSTTQEFTSAGDIRPAQPFHPPSGFTPLETKPSVAGEYFNPELLTGKQVFYITAPASLSVEKLKEISWKKAQQGEQVYSRGDINYSLEFDKETSKKGMRVMLPMKQGYKSVHAKVNHIFHFQEIPTVPSLKRPAGAGDSRPAKKRRREQPQGLRMRFRPTGFGSGSLGAMGASDDEEYADVDMIDNPPAGSSRRLALEAATSMPKEDTIPRDSEKSEGKRKEKKEKDKADKVKGKSRVEGQDDKEKRRKEKKKLKEKDREAANQSQKHGVSLEPEVEIRPKVTELQKENEALYGEESSQAKDTSKEKKKKTKKDKTKIRAEA